MPGKVTQRRPISTDERAQMEGLLRELSRPGRSPLAIFLGAGASRPFGYPITRELMLKILQRLKPPGKAQYGSTANAPRNTLSKFLRRLLPGERISEKRVPMVTGVLSLLDHSIASGQVLLPGSSMDETRVVRQQLEREIVRTIPDDKPFSAKEAQRFALYCNWLTSLYRTHKKNRLGLITSNYDMLADIAACQVTGVRGQPGDWDYDDVARKIDFGFRWAHPYRNHSFARPEGPKFSLYKLHGSTNWLRCPLCENLYVNPDGPVSSLATSAFSWRGNVCHCSKTRLESQIVSPSFIRALRDPNLIATWKNALDLLREAEHWVIIGYGFPDEDFGIRALFTRALSSHARTPKVSVIQWDDSAKANYDSFFRADKLSYYTGGLQLLLECSR